MLKAFTRGTKRLIDASKAKRWEDYVCPNCLVRVYLPNVVAQVPHFRHWPKEGKSDCDDFFPSTYSDQVGRQAKKVSAIEDTPSEPGLVLAGTRGKWGLALRLPEITNSDLGAASLGALQSAHVSVRINGEVVDRIPALEIRPGIGIARAIVPPTSLSYELVPGGTWPAGINTARWRTVARGLKGIGTVFRLRGGECIRLPEGSAVEWGERLCAVAERGVTPPSGCEPKLLGILTYKGVTWCAWEILLPQRPKVQVSNWLDALNLEATEPSWKVSVVTVPREIDADGVFVYSTDMPKVAQLKPPFVGATSLLTMDADSNSMSVRLEAEEAGFECFAELDAGRPGKYVLSVDDHVDAKIGYRVAPALTIEELRTVLRSIPRLRVNIGSDIFEAWASRHHVCRSRMTGDISSIKLLFGELEVDLRVDISWSAKEREHFKPDLAVDNAEKFLRTLLSEPTVTSIRIDSGALGSVELACETKSEQPRSLGEIEKRTARYIANLATAGRNDEAVSSAVVLRHAAIVDRRLLNVASRRTGTPAATMLRALAKRLGRR